MGIKQLFSIIKDEAPEAIKEGEIKNQFGRKVAIVCPRRPRRVLHCLTSFRMRKNDRKDLLDAIPAKIPPGP